VSRGLSGGAQFGDGPLVVGNHLGVSLKIGALAFELAFEVDDQGQPPRG